jgi:hypothetical protein
MAGCFGFDRCGTRGFLINWLIVGIPTSYSFPFAFPFDGFDQENNTLADRPIKGQTFPNKGSDIQATRHRIRQGYLPILR